MQNRHRYLFVRVLEACNADCFMCEFALSRDSYRFSLEDFAELLPDAVANGVGYVRFTGGEPLMHRDVVELVRLGTEHGMRMSIITNGMFLPRFVDRLADAGLAQVIVSLDGSSAATHDVYRRSPGMFDNGVEGLRRAKELGIIPRVNSVVGPHNFAQMPELQNVLTDIGVQQWELSAIKLDREIRYPSGQEVIEACEPIYTADPAAKLVPLGKRFYGDTPQEQRDFFEDSLPPRASEPLCLVTDDVIYLDGKNGRTFSCSCLPHKEGDEGPGGAPLHNDDGKVMLDSPVFRQHAELFKQQGPSMCSGCSATAAGYSDDLARMGTVPAWSY
ncbi:cytosylglucuronate decarboxylase [Streptomyces sp. NPDC048416]|uniref:cytosylglucuronate decarboxylase n=1 Tax=Streptomyces sp. NPDC048416 TaxID=3365546 RepID=UPI00371E6D3C